MGEREIQAGAAERSATREDQPARRASSPWQTVTMYLRDGLAIGQARMPADMVGAKLVRHRGMLFQWDAGLSGYVERQVFDAPENRR